MEFKEDSAKAGEYDLIVKDDGKIAVTDNIKTNFPLMENYVDVFNKSTSLFDHLGSNYEIKKSDEAEEPIKTAERYFENNGVDLLVSSVNNELIAVRPSDLCHVFNEGSSVASTAGNEIRTTGKNDAALTLEEYFNNSISDIAKIDENICQ